MGKRSVTRNTEAEVGIIIEDNNLELSKIINKLSSKYSSDNPADKEDLTQVGWAECVARARNYDKEKHEAFPRHVYQRISSVIAKHAKKNGRHKGLRRDDFQAPSDDQKSIIRNIVESKLDSVQSHIIIARFYNNDRFCRIASDLKLSVDQIRRKYESAIAILRKEFLMAGITGFDYNRNTHARLIEDGVISNFFL